MWTNTDYVGSNIFTNLEKYWLSSDLPAGFLYPEDSGS